MHVADDRFDVAHDLALERHQQPQHAVRGRVVGAEVERQQLLRGLGAARVLLLELLVQRGERDALLAPAVLGHRRLLPADDAVGLTRRSRSVPTGSVVLVVREDHRFAADREVAPLRVALVVLGHQDPAQVRMSLEDDAEHVVHLALLVVGGRPVRR